MALSSALSAGLSGLNVNQAKLSVVGNNIANANTVAFKSTRVLFKPQFYVTESGGSQPDGEMGGVNPSQRGLGATIGSYDRNFEPGSIEGTGKPTDLAIQGSGFFVVRSDEQKYTRDGTFRLNSNNELVTTSGDYVLGRTVDANYNLNAGSLDKLKIPYGASVAQASTAASFAGNLNVAGDIATTGNVLSSGLMTTSGGTTPAGTTLLTDLRSPSDLTNPLFTAGEAITLNARKGSNLLPEATFDVLAGSTLDDLMAFLNQSLGINTGVPDDGDPTTAAPGAALAVDATDPTAVRLNLAGNAGMQNTLTMTGGGLMGSGGLEVLGFTSTTAATGESVRTSMVVYDSLGTPITVGVTAVLESTDITGSTWRFFAESSQNAGTSRIVGSGTLTFDSLGRLRASTGTSISVSRAQGAATPLTVELDFSEMTALTDESSELAMTAQDGAAMGTLTDFAIGEDGKIIGSYSNGLTRTLGQLAIANFTNPAGLVDRGGNLFVAGANSGEVVIGDPGTLGGGTIVAGALELSNVDLSAEFVNLIMAQTGFSASSRVISTSNELLQALLNTR